MASRLASLWNKGFICGNRALIEEAGDFAPFAFPSSLALPYLSAPLSTTGPASGRLENREGKFLNVGCIKIWYNQKVISFHLAIKDCKMLESFEEFASNGCLTLQKRISPWGIPPACSVHGQGRYWRLCHFFYYFIGEKWLSVHVRFHCRVAGIVIYSGFKWLVPRSLKRFSREWMNDLWLHFTRFCPLINVVYILCLLWKLP